MHDHELVSASLAWLHDRSNSILLLGVLAWQAARGEALRPAGTARSDQAFAGMGAIATVLVVFAPICALLH